MEQSQWPELQGAVKIEGNRREGYVVSDPDFQNLTQCLSNLRMVRTMAHAMGHACKGKLDLSVSEISSKFQRLITL